MTHNFMIYLYALFLSQILNPNLNHTELQKETNPQLGQMALLTFCPVLPPNSISYSSVLNRTTPIVLRTRPKVVAASTSSEDSHKSTKLVTFLGKGGSGKTTSAVFAAQVSMSESALCISATPHMTCYSANTIYEFTVSNLCLRLILRKCDTYPN